MTYYVWKGNSQAYKLIIKYFPVVDWVQKYRLSYLNNDIIAGFSVGLTLIPQGLAYGSLAGLKPQYGLFAAFWGPFLYFIFGTSKDLTIGPTAILSLLVAHYSLQSGIPFDITYSVLLSLMSGCIQLILGAFSLGFIANYMSPTVVSGFTSSAALLIGFGQVPTWLGLRNINSELFLSIYDICVHISKTNISDMICGAICITILVLFKALSFYIQKINSDLSRFQRFIKSLARFICICANILVITISTIIAFYLEKHDIGNLSLIGNIKEGLPHFEVPRFEIKNGSYIIKTPSQLFKDIGTGIPIVTIIALVEAMAIGKAFARKNGYKIRSSQEFIAIGLSNIVGSFFQSLPTTGSFSRTAINSQCMSKSPLSGVITGSLVLLALRYLTPYFVYIPKSSLSAVIIVAVMFMTDFKFVFRTWRIKKYDCLTWLVTFLLSLGLGVEYGALIGIGFSFLPIVFIASRPKFEVSMNSAQFKGSFLWFPFISKLTSMIDSMEIENNSYVFLDLCGVYSVDSAVVNTLQEIGHDLKQRNKIFVIIINNLKIINLIENEGTSKNVIKCFKSYEEAIQFYPNLFDGSFLNERVPLLSLLQERASIMNYNQVLR